MLLILPVYEVYGKNTSICSIFKSFGWDYVASSWSEYNTNQTRLNADCPKSGCFSSDHFIFWRTLKSASQCCHVIIFLWLLSDQSHGIYCSGDWLKTFHRPMKKDGNFQIVHIHQPSSFHWLLTISFLQLLQTSLRNSNGRQQPMYPFPPFLQFCSSNYQEKGPGRKWHLQPPLNQPLTGQHQGGLSC